MSDLQLDDDERRIVRAKARAAALDALRTFDGEARWTAIERHARAHGGFTERELLAVCADDEPVVEQDLSAAVADLAREGVVAQAGSVVRLVHQ